ncbi:hypothetical protein M5K25_012742 [Dendrobium thyrsiflorum]|uniref:Uncharacterized protein n=1 Tax=Dendrobium thyrsiflorum TaxID=117978 RepID=A0ABD0UYQ4_DENTH
MGWRSDAGGVQLVKGWSKSAWDYYGRREASTVEEATGGTRFGEVWPQVRLGRKSG